MTRSQLEHSIRAACRILQCQEIYIVGSQSLLGSYPNVSGPVAKSNEVDLLPALEFLPHGISAEKATHLINGNIGEGSEFLQTHGFVVEGVEEGDLVLPKGWKARTVAVSNEGTGGFTGHCLDPHDMAAAKLAAGRPKDRETLVNLIRQGIIRPAMLKTRVLAMTDDQLFDGSSVADLVHRLARWEGLARPREA